MHIARVVTNERVDDLPLLLARQAEMGLAELIDKRYVPHGNWPGASPGEIVVVWPRFILSEGDHRLAILLRELSEDGNWSAFESDLNRQTI